MDIKVAFPRRQCKKMITKKYNENAYHSHTKNLGLWIWYVLFSRGTNVEEERARGKGKKWREGVMVRVV